MDDFECDEIVEVAASLAAIAPDIDAVFTVVQFQRGGMRMLHNKHVTVEQAVLMLDAAKTEVLLRFLRKLPDADSTKNSDT